MEQSRSIEFLVEGSDEGERIDIALSRRNIVATRSRAQTLIDAGHVLMRGAAVKPSYRLRRGDLISVTLPEAVSSTLEAEDIPLAIVYEDDALIVVDKPPGMVVHPAAGNWHGTLVNALLFHAKHLSGIGGVMRPGIVHRLDKCTSGLMVAAKSDGAHEALARQFRDRTVKKIYRVFVHGAVKDDEGFIDMAVGRHPVERKKMSTKSRQGRPAVSRWKVAERFGPVTLLDVRIETGRTHQIRVHLNAIGYPVLGDTEYGNSKKRIAALGDMSLRGILASMKRQALHAGMLGFTHPLMGLSMEFSSPLPPDMAFVYEKLREYGAGKR